MEQRKNTKVTQEWTDIYPPNLGITNFLLHPLSLMARYDVLLTDSATKSVVYSANLYTAF